MSIHTLPFVLTAVACEEVARRPAVLQEQSLISLVRVRTVIGMGKNPPPRMIRAERIVLQLFIALLRMEPGRQEGTLRLEFPSGKNRRQLGVFTAEYTETDPIANMHVEDFTFTTNEEGWHFVDVLIEGHLLTRIPLKVDYRRAPNPSESTH